jgi:hypothetical protein
VSAPGCEVREAEKYQKLLGEDLFFDVAQASQKFVGGLGVKWPGERIGVMEIGLTLRVFIQRYFVYCLLN